MGRASFLVVTLVCGACATAPIKLPTGSGAPATDVVEAIRQATAACRVVTSITAEIAVSGSVGGRRVRGRLLAGLAAPSSARLEAVAPFGAPLFIFVSRDDDASVLFPRDRRVLEHGKPSAVLERVAGVPLDGADLRLALTGCAMMPRTAESRRFGDDWRVVPDTSGDIYLHREARTGPWRLVAALHQSAGAVSWRSEYRDFLRDGAAAGLPGSVRLLSADGKRFDLRLSLSQIDVNTALDRDAFRIQIPPGVEPMTIEELQQSGPLSNAAGGK